MAGGLEDERNGVEAVLSTSRLLMLDDLWTAYLDQADAEEVARDLSDLQRLVADLKEGLGTVAVYALGAGEALANLSDEEVTSIVYGQLERHSDQLPEIQHDLEQDFADIGLRGYLVAASFYVNLVAEEEMGLLDGKLDQLSRGMSEAGDMRPLTRCALELAGTGFAVLNCATGPIGCISGVGTAAVGWIRGWKKSGCRELSQNMIEHVRAAGVAIP